MIGLESWGWLPENPLAPGTIYIRCQINARNIPFRTKGNGSEKLRMVNTHDPLLPAMMFRGSTPFDTYENTARLLAEMGILCETATQLLHYRYISHVE